MSATLKTLFISKVRIKLLEIFLQSPDELFYVRQLVRLIEEEINAVRRELGNMEKAQMLKRENRANRVYYVFNKKYIFYEDLAAMIAKTTGLGQKIVKNRQKLGKIKAVFFSINFVEHRKYVGEDLDVVIIGDVVLPEINALIMEEQALVKREINYTVMDLKEYEFRRTKRDPFVLSILMMPRIMIVGSQSDLFV